MKIMMSAGEASGDLHGAGLARALLAREPRCELIGFGGPAMREAGVRLAADMADYAIMGFWEVLRNLRRLWALLDRLTALMRDERPDLLVIIDYPDFNWRLARRAKALGIRVLSYIPPSAWAWRKGRARSCARLADELIAIFPFELPVYEAAGASIRFVGNPLVDTVRPSMPPEEARRRFGLLEGALNVMLLPGSRRQEIALLLPAMLEGARLIAGERPDARFFLPVAPGLDEDGMAAMAARAGVAVEFTRDSTYDLMGQMRFALATSGTVVMEAALMGLPCVVLYRLSPISYRIGKLLLDVPLFSLPNILLGEMAQPELLQDAVSPGRILAESRRFWAEPGHRERVAARLRDACAMLGEPGATGRVAALILAAARR